MLALQLRALARAWASPGAALGRRAGRGGAAAAVVLTGRLVEVSPGGWR